ncbi:hypothetical protein [Paucimonas lemoignei]|uniref:hypothetical protein n=1 Tax=Paucimonas lemoignei TaxID=29443 RepID=UPI00104EC4B0
MLVLVATSLTFESRAVSTEGERRSGALLVLLRGTGFSVLLEAEARVAGALAIDFAALLTAGRFDVPDDFAMTALLDGFCSAAFLVAERLAAEAVFFAVTDFTADLPEILFKPLFATDLAAVCFPLLGLFALGLAVSLIFRVFFTTVAFMARSLKQSRCPLIKLI